jgi:hypothetical protein
MVSISSYCQLFHMLSHHDGPKISSDDYYDNDRPDHSTSMNQACRLVVDRVVVEKTQVVTPLVNNKAEVLSIMKNERKTWTNKKSKQEVKQEATRHRARFLVDENDLIVPEIHTYEKPPANLDSELYLSKEERDDIFRVQHYCAADCFLDFPQEIEQLETIIQNCFFQGRHIRGSTSESRALSEDAAAEVSRSWAASDGRGLEGVLSEQLGNQHRQAVSVILDFQSLLLASESCTDENIQILLASESMRVSERARNFARVIAEGDAQQAQTYQTKSALLSWIFQ